MTAPERFITLAGSSDTQVFQAVGRFSCPYSAVNIDLEVECWMGAIIVVGQDVAERISQDIATDFQLSVRVFTEKQEAVFSLQDELGFDQVKARQEELNANRPT